MTVDKRAFTVTEAAHYMGKSVSFVRALKRDGKLPAKRDGKSLIFLRESLDAYLDALPQAEVAAMNEEAVNAKELATILRCSYDTVLRGAHDGSIPAFRLGRAWRFYPSVVRDALAPSSDPWAQPARATRKLRGRAA